MSESAAHASRRNEELAALVNLEARWENLRASRASAKPSSLLELQGNQRAYEIFHAKLIAYNKRQTPVHIPEKLINTAFRLEQWWPTGSQSSGTARATRPAFGGPRSVARELEMLAGWCSDLRNTNAAALRHACPKPRISQACLGPDR
jgi:hypothetical protein